MKRGEQCASGVQMTGEPRSGVDVTDMAKDRNVDRSDVGKRQPLTKPAPMLGGKK